MYLSQGLASEVMSHSIIWSQFSKQSYNKNSPANKGIVKYEMKQSLSIYRESLYTLNRPHELMCCFMHAHTLIAPTACRFSTSASSFDFLDASSDEYLYHMED